jgi:hypothetical protein
MTALGESTYEAVFDHGNDGYGIWFDGIVREDPMYRQHWKGLGLRPIYVKIEEDRIVISREVDRPMPGGPQFDADSLAGDDMHMDISLGDITGESEAAPASSEAETDVNASDDGAQVYTPEEAARLFVTSPDTEAPVAASETVEEAVEAKPKRRTTTRRRTTKADAAADTGADETTS